MPIKVSTKTELRGCLFVCPLSECVPLSAMHSSVPVGSDSDERATCLAYQRCLWNVLSWRGASTRCDPSRIVCSCPRRASSSERQDHSIALQCVFEVSLAKMKQRSGKQ